jgi:hypothetical protein
MNRYTDIDLKNKRLPPVTGYWSEKLVSLEEALKPIESCIEELHRSTKAAKKYCTFPSKHGLTHDESAAVYLYTMEGGQNSFYRVLNKALRSENRPALKPWFPFLKLFDVALKKLPTVNGSVWRGVPDNVIEEFTEGQVMTWWSISSCSQSVNVVQSFISSGKNSTLFMIEAVNAKDISSYSYYPNEKEVLLGLGTELRVKAGTMKHSGGLNIVHLVQLSDDDDEELPKTIDTIDLKSEAPVAGAAGNCSLHSIIEEQVIRERKFEFVVKEGFEIHPI